MRTLALPATGLLGGFLAGDALDEGGVALELAVQGEAGRGTSGEPDGGLDLADARMRGAAFRGEAQQGDARLDSQQRAGAGGGAEGDVGQLFGGRVNVQGAIGEDQGLVALAQAMGDFHDEEG